MAIKVLSEDAAGTIILQDEREEGAIVLLVCEKYERRGRGGIVDVPSQGPSDDRDGDWYPMLMRRRGIARSAFKIEVNTTNMPSGVQEFDEEQFIERARNEANRGVTRTTISPENAPDWGYRGPETEHDHGPTYFPR